MSNEYKARIVAELDTSKVEQQIKELGNKKIKFTAETGNSSKKVNEIDKSIKTAERSSRTFGDTLKRSLNIGAAASITAKGFQLIRTAANNAKEAVKGFDSSITKLRMATGGTYGETANLVSGYNSMGKQLGAITSEVSNGANAWLRQGHSLADTNTLIRDSMILAKVATLESADSTKYLTSAMKGYGVAAKDVIGIVDKLTAVDLVSATDAGGLAEGMSRTAQSAKLAGVSMDKLLGYLAVTGEVTQKSMSSIGEGFKTIFTRMADIKAGKLQFIDDDGTAESLSDVETVLTTLGIRLRESNNEFRNFGIVLDEVAANWSSYSSVQQAALSKAFAGTRQSENFKVLMENYDLAIEYMNVAADSAGTAEQKFGAYLDSIEAKSKSLQAAFESLSLNTISTELVGDILDISTSIIELLDETNLINGALAGIGAAGAIKGLTKLTTIIMNAVVRLNDFNKAMRVVKVADLGVNEIAQLANATRNLSNSQLKAVLSSKALTVEQRLAILTAHGMTQAEAKAALSAMGLATAHGTAAAATVTLSGTLKGLWATLKANPLILIATAVTAAVSVIQTLNDKQEEVQQKILETGEAAKEEAEALSTLYNEYKSAKAAYDANTGSKEQLDSATQSLLDSLGIEESQIDGLITKYGSLSAAIQQVSIEKLKASRDDLTAGLEAATEELLAKTEDGWLSGDFGTINFSLASGAYGEDPFADVLEAAGYKISSEFSNFGGYQGSFIDVGEGDTLEESLALYQELLNMQAKLSEGVDSGAYTREELLESPVYKAINDKIAEFETEVESVQSFIDEINSTSAQIIHMEFSTANGLPETQAQFESYKQTLINTAMSSGQFIGSQEAIEASIIDMLATLPEMSKFMTDYANELTSEKPTFKSFSEIIFDDPEDDKDAIDTLNKYLDQVKQLDDALAKINSGDFSASDFYALANDFPDLYRLAEETGSWEEAINALRTSIVGVKGESKDATTVFGFMSTMFKDMDWGNEENVASWVQFNQTVEDSVSTGEKAALTFNSMSDAMKGIGDAASFAAQVQEELATDGVNSLDTLQSLIGTFGAEAASSMYKVTTKGVIVDVEKVKEAYINAISEINGLSIQESAALDELWDMEFDKAEFDAFVDSMGKVEKAAGFVADAQKEIGENGHNSFETLTELYDLLGEDANKYISYADGKPIIDFEGVKQEYFDMIDEMEQASPELKQIMKDTFEFELEESGFDTLVDNYIADVQTLQDALKKVQEDGLEPIDMYKLMDEFPELKGKSEDLEGAIIDLLCSMDADVIAAFNEQFGKCESEEDRKELEDFMEVVLAVGKVVGETQFAIDISAEAEGMDNLFTAIKESVSSTGLAAESIENLKKRYASLSGVDVSSLFERTENGIHLNTKALRELESEYEKVTKTALDTKLNDLVDQYNKLTEQIDNAGIAASTVDLYAQRNDILQQINETADLASQYAGLTSAFYKWEQAQSMGEEGDMYDSLTGGLENVKQLYEDGLVGTNKFRTAVQLMSSEDLSNATAAELIDAYEAGYPKMQRYFQDSSDGVLNFLHDVQDLNSEWAHLNEDGSWDIDFGVGGDQEIADALGINVEAVQSILRKLSDYGFDINLDMQYSDLDTVQTKAEKAAETLKKLGATDYQFNFGATNIDRVEEQITEAEKALDKFRNEDGSINLDLEGAEEAQYILAALVLQKQSLESPTILSIDAGNIDGAVGETLRKLQKIKTSYNNMQLQAAIGADTSQIQSEINSTISSLTTEELEIAAQLGIDTTTSLETLNSQISEITPEMLLTVGVNQEAVTAFMESSHDTSANVTYNVRDHRVRAYKAPGKTGNVTYEADMIAWEPPTKYGKIVYTATYASPSKGETNRGQGVAASGTAYAQGDWSTKRSGTALGGELGREIVVLRCHTAR